MPTFPPAALAMARRCPPWGIVLTTAVLTAPLVIVIAALVPALVIGPFLPERHQRLTLRLLGSLREWATAITSYGATPRGHSQAQVQ